MPPWGAPGIPVSTDMGPVLPSAPLDQPKALFRYGEQSIWSTQRHIAAAAIANTTFRLFTTPISQQGQGFAAALTIAETNLKEGGRIPSGVAYDVFGIACHVMQGVTATDMAAPVNDAVRVTNLVNVQNNGVLSWDFTQTQVDISPIVLIGAGGGVFGGISSTQNLVDRGHLNNGAGSVWLYRRHPVALPGNSTFSVLLRYGGLAPAIGAGFDVFIRVILLGYYKNVIEIG